MSHSGSLDRLSHLRSVWDGEAPAEARWLTGGLAIEGDFAGIQSYVLKPVPGARGAAKRLRARSFRVADRTKKIADEVCGEFPGSWQFYVAGGRFLICAPREQDWERKLAGIQARLDRKLFEEFGGEVAFHLAGAAYDGDVIPRDALFAAHQKRRARPLEHALLADGGWDEKQFFQAAGEGWGKCPACLRTELVSKFRETSRDEEDEENRRICADCFRDRAEQKARGADWPTGGVHPGSSPVVEALGH